ncbi:peptide synthetase [Pluteus cervinus]|uniref:Peptide synthetase n=1 Tax=Pluteus cervinus TaxID=181527 RepID=A0ACD3BDG4_9AGAR|nr:peptide synthetase [Pluteus cervinus]
MSHFCSSVLAGYHPVQWPDLAAHRFPQKDPYSVQLDISPVCESILVAVLARVLGAYTGTSDLLVAVGQTATFVRVTWSTTSTWSQVTETIFHDIRENAGRIFLADIRRVLDLDERQTPCLAQFCSGPAHPNPSDFPLVVWHNTANSSLTVLTSPVYAHPSVAKQLLAQVVHLAQLAASQLDALVHDTFSLPADLLSIHERVQDADLPGQYPRPQLVSFVYEYLTARAQTHPNHVAMRWYPSLSADSSQSIHSHEEITYLQLDQRSNQFSRWLIASGLGVEDRVAVCMARDLTFHVAMIGIMKAGGCYVPIDPDLPEERKSYIARDADARFVLTTTDLSPSTLFGSRTVYMNDIPLKEAVQTHSDQAISRPSPDNLAFLLYTSGTTGLPKGCLLTHHGLAQVMLALGNTAANVRMENVSDGRYLAVASIAFDVHLAETWVPVTLGIPLFSAPRSQLLGDLPYYVKSLGITHVGIVPSLIEATMGAVQTDGVNEMALRYIASGGEKMSDSILDKWADHPQVRLANYYGPSEATIGCCARVMDSTTPRSNIGRPFANVSGYVVDRDLNIVLRGGLGELVVEGPLVGRGYHGRPDLTQKVFMEWPGPGCWSYRTGDLVRMMPDGTLEILGRIDSQIKLRGVRIESEGVSAIVRKGGVACSTGHLDAVTVLAKHPRIGAEQLVSFIAWDSSITVSIRKSSKPYIVLPPKGLIGQIRTVCDVELASYMRPSHIIPISWLPLSSNGKSDDKVLVTLFNSLDVDILANILVGDLEDKEEYPASQAEKDVFSVLLRHIPLPLHVFRPDINVFECGVDSMSVIRFASDLKATLGYQLTASEIMKMLTISGIAAAGVASTSAPTSHLASRVEQYASERLPEIIAAYLPDSVEAVLPPFTVQEGVLSRSVDQGSLYVQHVVLRLGKSVSLPRLQQAWNEVLDHHPILRTVFYFGRELSQVVLSRQAVSPPWSEVSVESDKPDPLQWFMNTKSVEISHNLNEKISEIPPWRLTVCNFGSAEETLVALSIHHALYDGISLPILVNGVSNAYHGHPHPLQCESTEILEHLAAARSDEARSFWENYFSGLVWPTKILVPSSFAKMKTEKKVFNTSLSSMKSLAAAQKITLQGLLTSAFAEYLATKVYQTTDICFGVIRSGRLLPLDGIETTICPMICVLPFRVDLSRMNQPLSIQSNISAMVEFEHTPLGKIQSWVRPGEALFEALFSVSVKEHSHSDLWDVLLSEPPQADFPLAVEVVIDHEKDTLVLQVAWLEDDEPVRLVSNLLKGFEPIVQRIGQGGGLDTPGSIVPKPQAAPPRAILENVTSTDIIDPTIIPKLKEIVADFLRVDALLVADNTSLISLGLDSIKSVGLARTLGKAGFRVAAVDLMKYSSLVSLANLISSSSEVLVSEGTEPSYQALLDDLRSIVDMETLKLSDDDRPAIFPTTTLQAGLLSQTIASQGRLYMHVFPMRLSTSTDIDRLKRAWIQAIEAFSILRTSFHFLPETGVWIQVVHSSYLGWDEILFSTDAEYQHFVEKHLELHRPENEKMFGKPPLWLRLYRSTTDKLSHRFVIYLHHALYDGLSIVKLLGAVRAIYEGATLDPTPQFVDFMKYFISQEQLGTAYWAQLLKGLRSNLLLPSPKGEQAVTSHSETLTVVIDKRKLNDILKTCAITTQCLGQATWSILLASLSRSSDVVFGHTISGRSIPNSEDVIGPMLNTIPFRIQLDPQMTNSQLLKAIHSRNIAALAWHHASLRSIQRELQLSQLWDSLFLFQPADEDLVEEESLWNWDEISEEAPEIQYPINIEMQETGLGFNVVMAYKSSHLNGQQSNELLHRFGQLIESLASNPDGMVSESLDFSTLVRVEHPAEEIYGSLPSTITPFDNPSVTTQTIQTVLASISGLPVSKITLATPLVSLGIDSITAIRVVSKCRELGFRLQASDVVQSRTLLDLLNRAAASEGILRKSVQSESMIPPFERERILVKFGKEAILVEDILPMAPGMKWLLGAWQRSDRTRFQNAFALNLRGSVDAAKFREAWIALVHHHAILRSTFATGPPGGEPRLVVFNQEYSNHWTHEHLDSIDDGIVQRKMLELIEHPAPSMIPPTKGLLLTSDQKAYFIIQLHHVQYDAWSLQLLLDDLSCLYHDNIPGSSHNLAEFLAAVTPSVSDQELQRKYWQNYFPRACTSTFPNISTSVDCGPQQRTIITIANAVPDAAHCEARARDLQLSLQAVLLACWAKIQSEYCSREAIVFGLWHAGRLGVTDDIERLAVPCVNILPICVSAIAQRTSTRLAASLQDDLKARSGLLEQSDFAAVHRWVGSENRPLTNVFVNIVKVAPELSNRSIPWDPVKVQYQVSGIIPNEDTSVMDKLKLTELIQDDVMIDIGVDTQNNTLLMSVDCSACIMDEGQAVDLIKKWAVEVRRALPP